MFNARVLFKIANPSSRKLNKCENCHEAIYPDETTWRKWFVMSPTENVGGDVILTYCPKCAPNGYGEVIPRPESSIVKNVTGTKSEYVLCYRCRNSGYVNDGHYRERPCPDCEKGMAAEGHAESIIAT